MKNIFLKKSFICGIIVLFVGTSVIPSIIGNKIINLDLEKPIGKNISSQNVNLGLIAWWNFDEGSGTIAHDIIGGYDGTINDATWTTGISGSGLYFDGSNDYVQIASPVLNVPPYSVCSWVNASSLPGPVTAYIISNGGQTGDSYGFYLNLTLSHCKQTK